VSSQATGHDVSVVICTYSNVRWGDLVAAVRSVEEQTPPPAEIVIVVDHNSGLLVHARTAFPGALVVPNGQTRGLSGARNSGVAASTGSIVAFLDDDASAEPGWLAGLLGPYEDAKVVAVGGSAIPAWDARRPAWFPGEFDWVVGCSYVGLPRARANVRNVIGCNMSFRRSVLDLVGGFRPEIGRVGTRPVGCEATDLCIRAARTDGGAGVVYEPAARVRHRVPASRGTVRYFVSRCYSEGRSKAIVSALVGAGDGLSSERAHTLRTLPAGMVRALGDGFRTRRVAGFARATMIPIGLVVTGAGYLVGLVGPAVRPSSARHEPSR